MHQYRERLKEPTEATPHGDPLADTYLDCASCQQTTRKVERSMMGCGWLAPDERQGEDWLRPNGAPEATVCPGYTVSLPEVIEAARALGWRQDGQLREFYDGEQPTDILKNLCDVVASEVGKANRHGMRERRVSR